MTEELLSPEGEIGACDVVDRAQQRSRRPRSAASRERAKRSGRRAPRPDAGGRDRGVLRGALPEPERNLDAFRCDPERHDVRAALQLEPVEHQDREPGIGEAMGVLERAAASEAIPPGTLTLGTDNGSAFTARRFKGLLSSLGIAHRRGGYRDPESQAFIESWFSKLKERCVWRQEFETLEQAREVIAAYIDRYHDRPHQGLGYRTPAEVRRAWDDAQEQLQKAAA